MVYYCFALDDDCSGTEVLGGISLVDDDEARIFGKQVIQDLQRGGDHRAICTILITEGRRTVGSIPFEPSCRWRMTAAACMDPSFRCWDRGGHPSSRPWCRDGMTRFVSTDVLAALAFSPNQPNSPLPGASPPRRSAPSVRPSPRALTRRSPDAASPWWIAPSKIDLTCYARLKRPCSRLRRSSVRHIQSR